MPRSNAVRKTPTQAPAQAQVRTKVRPVRSASRILETQDHQVGQDRPRRMKSRGPARESLEPTAVEVVDRAVTKEKLEMLAFMEEPVTVLVHDSTNPTDDPLPEVFNDGRVQRFPRGQEIEVKRKFVEVLARAKKTVYSQRKVKDENGDETYVQVPHTALKYPFAVIHDPNPRGKAWLKGILQEA